MLGNIYQTKNGIKYMQDPQPASQLIQFCEYSINSCHP